MRYLLFLIFFISANILSAQTLLEKKIDFKVEQLNISEALLQLSKLSDIPISFGGKLFDKNKSITLDLHQTSFKKILQACLRKTNVGFKTKNNRIYLYSIPPPQHYISGYIEDARSGERLIAANIWKAQSQQGCSSNDYGFYSLKLAQGLQTIQISYLGYQTIEQKINLRKDTVIKFSLKPSYTLQEVIVTPENRPMRKLLNTAENTEIDAKQIIGKPSLGGEPDIFRYLSALPGVQTGADGLGGLNVRGGSSDQNLVLMDGIPVYNPSHTLGLFSIFNTSAIRSAKLTKSNFSARYNGRLSSILEIHTKEGNTKHFAAELSTGLLASRLTLEGPIVKNKSAYFISVRRTHLDPLIKLISSELKNSVGNTGESNYNFFDFNFKWHGQFSKKDKVYLSYYLGRDFFRDETDYFSQEDVLIDTTSNHIFFNWGNNNFALRWNHTFGPRLFANTAFTFSSFSFRNDDSFQQTIYNENTGEFTDDFYFSGSESSINDYGFKIDFDYALNNKHYLKFGSHLLFRNFVPKGISISENFSNIEIDSLFNVPNGIYSSSYRGYSLEEFRYYFEDRIKISNKLSATFGLNISTFDSTGKYESSLQPRLNFTYFPKANSKWYCSIGKMSQHMHVLTSYGSKLPIDLWVPASKALPAEWAWQFNLGHTRNFSKKLSWNIEAYYKKMNNLVKYKPDAAFPDFEGIEDLDYFWEEDVVAGQGWSYGVETMLSKSIGKTTGYINYTLSQASRQFDAINNGQAFPYKYDRRHQVHLQINQKLGKHFDLSFHWNIGSGQAITLVASEDEFIINTVAPSTSKILSKINGYRLPPYHHLDFAIQYRIIKPKWQHRISLSLSNIYAHGNVYYAFKYQPESDPSIDDLIELATPDFPLPGLSYTLNFGRR